MLLGWFQNTHVWYRTGTLRYVRYIQGEEKERKKKEVKISIYTATVSVDGRCEGTEVMSIYHTRDKQVYRGER